MSEECERLILCVCPELSSLCSRTRTLPPTDTHKPPNPPLLLTNERIITFADMWRGGGEGEEGATVHFSKQEMNSPCRGHLSPGRGAQSPCCPLKPKPEPETPVELTASSAPPARTCSGFKPVIMEERMTKMVHSTVLLCITRVLRCLRLCFSLCFAEKCLYDYFAQLTR